MEISYIKTGQITTSVEVRGLDRKLWGIFNKAELHSRTHLKRKNLTCAHFGGQFEKAQSNGQL